MSIANLIRWSGLDAIGSGLLFALGWILIFVVGSDFILVSWALVISHILTFFAITGVYAFQSEESGVLGLLGFVVTITANAFVLGLVMAGDLDPSLAILGPAGTVGFGVGYLLLGTGTGLASMKANNLPPWAVLLWTLGPAVTVVGLFVSQESVSIVTPIGAVLFGLGFIGIGIGLWQKGT